MPGDSQNFAASQTAFHTSSDGRLHPDANEKSNEKYVELGNIPRVAAKHAPQIQPHGGDYIGNERYPEWLAARLSVEANARVAQRSSLEHASADELCKVVREGVTGWRPRGTIMPHAMDVVYTWTNGSHASFVEALDRASEQLLGKKRTSSDSIRFRDNDELRFSLRSLVQHFPSVSALPPNTC